MKISVSNSAVIKAPAARVWQILADDFTDISQWATGVLASGPNPNVTSGPAGSPIAGRSCTVEGFGVTDERITAFDAAARSLAYTVAAPKLPGFVRRAENAWAIREVSADTCEVTSTSSADLAGLMGTLASPMLKKNFTSTIGSMLKDLPAYAETGVVSARKKDQIQRA